MKIVCDEGVERQIVEQLRADDHDVLYVAEESPGITDDQVLSLASGDESLLVTSDKDFGELVHRLGRVSGGVLLLRLAGLSNDEKAALVASTVNIHEQELVRAFSVLTAKSIRIRRQK